MNYLPQKLLTTEEVAELLQVSKHTIEKWRGSKSKVKIPYVCLGKNIIRYRYEDISKFIDECLANKPKGQSSWLFSKGK